MTTVPQFTINDFSPRQRVQLHPGTDRWARGDRYGEVVSVGRLSVRIHMDRSGHTIRVSPDAIVEIVQ
jgi:hypothetical protein